MSDPMSDNVHHVRREPLETEVAATSIGPLDSGDVPITVVNRDTRRGVVMAALRRLRARVFIPVLLGATVEWIARQARRRPGTVAIAGAAVVSTVIVSGAALALVSNDQPLAAPPTIVERVTLPPLPIVTHTITATATLERTSTPPPATINPRRPSPQDPPRSSGRARPTSQPPAKPTSRPTTAPRPKADPTSPAATGQPERLEPARPAPAPPSDAPRMTAESRPQPTTQASPDTPKPTRTQKAPEPAQTSGKPQTPEPTQTSEPPAPSPGPPTTKPCTIQIGLGGIKLCVSL